MSEPLARLTEEDVKAMTPEQIVAARKAGQLDAYLGVPVPEPPFTPVDDEGKPRSITEEDLKHMSAEEIVAARRAGRLAHLGYAPGGTR